MNICIGTSGFQYPEWKGSFYPQDMPVSMFVGSVRQAGPARLRGHSEGARLRTGEDAVLLLGQCSDGRVDAVHGTAVCREGVGQRGRVRTRSARMLRRIWVVPPMIV